MMNRASFFVMSLVAIVSVRPAFAATATEDWVKNYAYKKATVNTALTTLNTNFIGVRNNIYDYDDDKNSPTYQKVKNPLRTDGQNAFDGINEVLEKVDGNNGTSNSAVQLETTAKNAFGAINELKGQIDDLEIPMKVSDLDNDSNYVTSDDLGDYVTSDDLGDYVTAEDLGDYVTADGVENNKKYIYTKDGWSEIKVKDTFPG